MADLDLDMAEVSPDLIRAALIHIDAAVRELTCLQTALAAAEGGR